MDVCVSPTLLTFVSSSISDLDSIDSSLQID